MEVERKMRNFVHTGEKDYHGVRKRKWGKWVSEIREPGKKTRIWLGSFESAEMAAVAHDVAVLCLKGNNGGAAAQLNFPDFADQLPRPASSSANDIRSAALEATAVLRRQRIAAAAEAEKLEKMSSGLGCEEMGLDSPRLWVELAEALLLAPPHAGGEAAEECYWATHQTGISLWDSLV